MPGLWDENEFHESGFASIKEFIGVLTDVEEDVPGTYGDQLAFYWNDVELTDAGSDVVLENGEFTDWIKQNSRKNTTNQKTVAAYREFKESEGLDGSMVRFGFMHGLRARYRRVEFDFGPDLSAGKAFVPVEIIGTSEAPAKAKKSAAPVEEDDEPEELDPKLVTAVLAAVDEDGATGALIKAAVSRKASTRKLLEESGGIATVLAQLVEDGVLSDDDGVFTVAESDEDVPEDDEEDLV